MGVIQSVGEWLQQPLAGGNPNNERYWQPSGSTFMSASGVAVTPERAFQVSAVFQGVRLIAETLGALDRVVYRQEGEARVMLPDHLLAVLLREERVNPWQTSQQFIETMTAYSIAWQHAIAEIRYTPQPEFWPIEPWKIHSIEQQSNGELRYQVHQEDGSTRPVLQEDTIRLQGLGLSNFANADLLSLAKEAIGCWIAMEKFGSLYFARGASQRLVLKHPGTLSQPAQERLRHRMETFLDGLDNAWRIFVAEEGMDPQPVGFSARDSQMTEAREAQVLEVARWLNIPEHMMRAGKQPTFASAEMFGREFVDYTIGPWDRRWGAAFKKHFLIEPNVCFGFKPGKLLRGSVNDQYEAFSKGVASDIISRDEARIQLGYNPEGREALLDQGRGQPGDAVAESPRLKLLASSVAGRVLRREQAQIATKALKMSGQEWIDWLGEFYADHAAYIADALQVPIGVAQQYAERQRERVESGGVLKAVDAMAMESLVKMAREERVK